LRQLLGYLAGARGHYVTAGTPEQIADFIEDWFQDGAADGFNICRRCCRRSSTCLAPR
jgi:alkanesulfonate monooxygenase SsuD/methylene tetrahydromethanopterin reductase-like flavin-dependent oxidoreductase (luciferase family)